MEEFGSGLYSTLFNQGCEMFKKAVEESNPEMFERALEMFERLLQGDVLSELRGLATFHVAQCRRGLYIIDLGAALAELSPESAEHEEASRLLGLVEPE